MHSILLHADLTDLEQRFGATVDTDAFAELFRKRLHDPSVKICKAIEFPFATLERFSAIRPLVLGFHEKQEANERAELDKQKKRLAVAQQKLTTKETKTLKLEVSRAEKKMRSLERKIKSHANLEPKPWEARVFPYYHAPLLVRGSTGVCIRPFRMLLRSAKKDASSDRKYPSLYKAKIESLSPKYFARIQSATSEGSVWRPLFGKQHGVLVFKRFYENVAGHVTVKGKTEHGNLVLGFEKEDDALWLAPCLWDKWSKGKETLYSFAIITQPAPEKIQKQGYHRCPVSLSTKTLPLWLSPKGVKDGALYALLEDSMLQSYRAVA